MTDSLTTILTTREQAILILIVIFISWSLSQKNIRKSVISVLKTFFQWKILLITLGMATYVILIILLLFQLKLWNINLLKNTIFWFAGTALILLVNTNNAIQDKKYFRKIMIKSLKFTLLLTFLINFYTFPLIIELILLPTITTLLVISVYTNAKQEYLPVKKVVDTLLSVWGVFIIIYVLINALTDSGNLLTINNLLELLLPILLNLLLLPFLYCLTIFMAYENSLIRAEKLN